MPPLQALQAAHASAAYGTSIGDCVSVEIEGFKNKKGPLADFTDS
jgi:hypothetical protein